MKKFIILLIFILALCPISLAEEIYSYPSETSIKWDYSEYLPVQNISFDGEDLFYANLGSGVFVSYDLNPNETHIFGLYKDNIYYSKEETTLKEEQTEINSLINRYALLLLAAVFLLLSAWIGTAGYISLIFSLLGLLEAANNSDFMLGVIFLTGVLISIASLRYDR